MYQVETRNFLSCLSFESEMCRRIQQFDWSSTSLGQISTWPLSLQNAVTLMLSSGNPMVLTWGEEFIQIYNDAYSLLHAGQKNHELGQSAALAYPEAKQVKATGHFLNRENFRLDDENFFSLSLVPLRDDDFEIEGVLITYIETTEKVKLKQQLVEYQHNLSVRDEFMSIASHDLKSPLTALKLQTQTQRQLILKKDPRGFDKERIKQFSEVVDEQVGRLNRMVDDMLEIGRIRRGKTVLNKHDVELGRLVRDAIESVRTSFSTRNFPIVETNGVVKGYWDQEKIKQVVANLLINAARFGELNPIHVKVEMENGAAKLSVRDKGIGIPHENVEKIFERYERVAPKDKTKEGHGLFLTKKIVELHNGKIWVDSKVGEGSTFYVLLPV